MIKVGTICILTGDHSRAGQCCEVLGPPRPSPTGFVDIERLGGIAVRCTLPRYPIAIRGEPIRRPSGIVAWSALRRHLIPIAPPGLTEGDDTRQPVREVA